MRYREHFIIKIVSFLIIGSFLTCPLYFSALASLQPLSSWPVLYDSDFGDSSLEGWQSEANWQVKSIESDHVLKGIEHSWVTYLAGYEWSDYLLAFDFKIVKGAFHANVRHCDAGRYFIGFAQDRVSLQKQFWAPETFFHIDWKHTEIVRNKWYRAGIKVVGSTVQIELDGNVLIEYIDENKPVQEGSIAFESLDNSIIYIANITVTGKPPAQTSPPDIPEDWIAIFESDFEDDESGSWALEPGWGVEVDFGGDSILCGRGQHTWAIPLMESEKNYTLETPVKLIEGGIHVNLRTSDIRLSETERIFARYFLGIDESYLSLNKQVGDEFTELASTRTYLKPGEWHDLRIDLRERAIAVYIDNDLKLQHEDASEPLLFGTFSFEHFTDSQVCFHEVFVFGPPPPEDLTGYNWIRTGGPSGGLGYDVRIHPLNNQIMFVTDNPSGVNKSLDGGKTWSQKNEGIISRTGPSMDGIPNYAITIDPGNPDIIWAGMQDSSGVYKSMDCGETWMLKNDGISGVSDITIRNFGIHPYNSDIVFAGTEITTGNLGIEFDMTKGKIFKTEDGGENWRCVWEGDNLARFILFNYDQPNILYASTGIFDREASNEKGVGVLKSTDGGESWFQINNGIQDRKGNRFVGFLEMHPFNPNILFAASGNNSAGPGGIFRTINGGEDWQTLLTNDIFTVVTISESDPDVIYAGSSIAFYRSANGGDTWKTLQKPGQHSWGPPGIRPGFPISAVVDPEDSMTIFVNNYGGGSFKSTDGGETWTNASDGYTGAQIYDIAINQKSPSHVLAIGRSGPFKSKNCGVDWSGIAYNPAVEPEWNAIAMHPENPKVILISDEFHGNIFKSINGGQHWDRVFKHAQISGENPKTTRHGFSDIQFAPSNPNIIYAGMRKGRRTIDGDFPAMESFGMYKSQDSGNTWTAINQGLNTQYINIHCIAVHPDNPDIVYIGTWMDGIFKTTDGGKNWKMINNGLVSGDIRSLAIDHNNPIVVYAGLGDGLGVYRTLNGGDTWHAINNGIEVVCPSDLLPAGQTEMGISLSPTGRSPVSPDYYSVPWTSVRSIVIDPTDSSILYAADYSKGVYATFDGGENWFAINNGLTTRAVSAMAISEDGARLYAATDGEGVFFLNLKGDEHYPPDDDDLDVPEDDGKVIEDDEGDSEDRGRNGSGCFIKALI